MEQTGDEVKRLQGCINDLIGVLALPALWSGHELSQVVSTLLDAMVGMLRLDFAYARLNDSFLGSPIEMVRTARRGAPPLQPEPLGRALNVSFKDDRSMLPRVMRNPLGEGHVSIAPLRFGVDDSIGIFVAGSQRNDFPTSMETLLLRVAVNQAAIGLHEARILSEQKRAAEELEQNVAERTADLIALNDELKIEIADRERAEKQSSTLKDELAAELTAMNRLHEFSTRLVASTELQPLLEEVLNATMTLQSADFGNVQLYNPETQALEIVAQRGFESDFLDYFGSVREDGAACGRALQRRERVIIEDVQCDPAFTPHRQIAAAAGFRAVQSTPLFSRNGEPLGMLSTHFRQPHRPSERELRLTDLYVMQAAEMIDLKRAEEALRRSETYMAEGQRLSHTGSWAWYVSRKEIFWSQEHFRILGLDPGTVKPSYHLALQCIHPEDRSLLQETLDRAVHEKSKFAVDCRIVCPDGMIKYIHTLAHPVFNESGELTEYVGTTIDMTERKRAEDELRESERRFRLLAESIPHHVWTYLPDGSLGYYNQQLADYVGLTPAELQQGGRAALHPGDVEHVKTAWREAWLHGTPYEVEQRLRGRDGQYHRFVSRATPVHDGQGNVVEWYGTNTDVEERRLVQDALRKAHAELAHLARVMTLGELAASIAHEVSQPLAATITNGSACLRWLARETPDLDEARAAVERMIRDANRASDVIRQIRTLVKKTDMQKTCLHTNDVIHEVISLVNSEVRKNEVALRTELSADLPPVLGDRIQLQQVLLNLIINGIDAMHSVTDRPRQLLISSENLKAGEVLVAVRDSGIGLQPEIMEQIFKAFYTTKPNGLGMGLSISHSIIAAHNGRLWAAPNNGPGVTFQFTLPADASGESQTRRLA